MTGVAKVQRLEQSVPEMPKGTLASGDVCQLPGDILTWEYECHSCKARFHTPVPRGPKEERNTKCPRCASPDIERMNVANLQEPTCGG